MVLPDKYLRKAYKAAMTGYQVYEGMVPTDATAPYILIIQTESVPVHGRCITWNCIATIYIFSEYQEFGGDKTINEITQDIINNCIDTYLTVDNFTMINTQLISSLNDVQEVGSVNIFRQVLRISHQLNES